MGNPTIGFIGLGIMGKPMARNLLKAGYPLVVYNRSRAAVDELSKEGAQAAASSKEVAARSEVIITMLPDSPDVELVYVGRKRHFRGRQGGHAFDRHVEHLSDRRAEAGSRCSEERYGYAGRASERG